MAYRIERSTVQDKQEAVWHLLVQHRDELTTNKELMVLAPDWPRYKAMEDAGMLVTLFVYFNDEIVGYSCNIVGANLHYAGLRYAHNDVLYTAPEHRGRVGMRLIHETERVVAEEGAKLMLWHAKPDTALDVILPRLGYRLQDKMYTKELAHGT